MVSSAGASAGRLGAGACEAEAETAVFDGEYKSRVDDKGRVIIPAKLREAVPEAETSEGLMMRVGEDGCVTLYTMARWREVEGTVNQVAGNSRSARRYRHFVFTQAEPGQWDRQGRLRIPASSGGGRGERSGGDLGSRAVGSVQGRDDGGARERRGGLPAVGWAAGRCGQDLGQFGGGSSICCALRGKNG